MTTIGAALEESNQSSHVSKLIKPVKQSALFDSVSAALTGSLRQNTVHDTEQQIDTSFSLENPSRILIAEDNQINQKLIKRILEKFGYDIQIAQNGLEVLEMAKNADFDFILMDIQMPEMDGLDATKKIRQLTIKQPFITAMTANAMPEDKEICINADMDAYLSKPMKVLELKLVLQQAVQANILR